MIRYEYGNAMTLQPKMGRDGTHWFGGSEAETDCLLFLSGIGMDIVLLCFCCGCKSANESTRLI